MYKGNSPGFRFEVWFFSSRIPRGCRDQRLDYIHNKPVEAGFVDELSGYTVWLHCSARDHIGAGKGSIKLGFID